MKVIYSFIKCVLLVLLGSTLLLTSAFSAQLTDNLKLNGFFTLDATVTDEDIALISNSDHTVNYQKNKPSLKNSLLGAQLTYSISDRLSAIFQGKIYNEDNIGALEKGTSLVQLDWAYLTYELGADFNLRAGNFIVPFMQGTELRSIGFSRLWARPVIANSGASGYKKYTGIELLKHVASGRGNWDFQLAAGKSENNLESIDNKHLEMLAIRYQQDNFWLRAALLSTEYDVNTANVRLKDSAWAIMYSTEAEYTIANVIINIGYSMSKTDITPDDSDLYLSLAYDLGFLKPYIYYTQSLQRHDLLESQDNTTPQLSLGSSLIEKILTSEEQIGTLEGDKNTYQWAMGARYDLNEQYAVKIQIEHSKHENNTNVKTGDVEGNALTLVLEGIF